MIAVQTEHEKVMADIMNFTTLVLAIADRPQWPLDIRVRAIYEAERMFHGAIMAKMVNKCAKHSEPCRN